MHENDGCIFCDIIAGRAKSYTIYEDDSTMAFLDINPWSKGHALVIPKRHVPWWHQLSDEETSALFHTAKLVSNRIMNAFSPDFVFLYARGRRIPHTHLFLIPTYSGDFLDRMFNALEQIQETPQDMVRLKDPVSMEETARLLRSL